MQAFDKLKDMEGRVGDLERELHWTIVYEIESVRLCEHYCACYIQGFLQKGGGLGTLLEYSFMHNQNFPFQHHGDSLN